MVENRKFELSFANIICCLTVIFIHVNSEGVILFDKSSVWYSVSFILWQASSFAVYGFIFLSGIKQFLKADKKFSALRFYKKRLLSVVLPYLLWITVYYTYDCYHKIESFNIGKFFYYIYSGDYIGHFYFIIIILQFYLLMPLWIRLFKRISALLMIPFALMISIVFGQYLPQLVGVFKPDFYFGFADRTFTTYFFYWTIGAYIGMNYDKAIEMLKANKVFIYSSFVVISIFTLPLTLYSSLYARGYTWLEIPMTLYRICAVIFLFTFSLEGISKICKLSFLRCLDASTYNIYLCHCLVLKIVNTLFIHYDLSRLRTKYLIRFVVVYTVSIGLCMLYSSLKRRLLSHRVIHR